MNSQVNIFTIIYFKLNMQKWCEYGKVMVDLPENHRQVGDLRLDVIEHAEFTGPCPGCLRKWGVIDGHRLVLIVQSDHEGILNCNVGFDLT